MNPFDMACAVMSAAAYQVQVSRVNNSVRKTASLHKPPTTTTFFGITTGAYGNSATDDAHLRAAA
jgi:hypothetical protein